MGESLVRCVEADRWPHMTYLRTSQGESEEEDEVTVASERGQQRYEARQEARPLKPEEITDPQWHAIEGIYRHLHACAERRWNPTQDDPGPVPSYDESRWNQVFLIEGDRGTGKTATFITLLDALAHLHRGAAGQPRPHAMFGPAPGKHHHQLEQVISPPCFVPLETVDMRPLPETQPLVLMLLGAFDRVVKSIDQRTSTGTSSVALRVRDLRRQYNDVLRAATVGWAMGPLRTEVGNLTELNDDLQRVDAWRRALLPAFRRFVDTLVLSYEATFETTCPLFVLPIDDADMAPSKSMEVLDLVRNLMHPRLAYVVTGNWSLFIMSLAHQFAKEFGRPPGLQQGYDANVAVETTKLAVKALTKAVPAAHVFRVTLSTPQAEDLLVKLVPAARAQLDRLHHAARTRLLAALPDNARGIQDLAARIRHEPFLEAFWNHAVAYDYKRATEDLAGAVRFEEGAVSIRGAAIRVEHELRDQFDVHTTGLPELQVPSEVVVGLRSDAHLAIEHAPAAALLAALIESGNEGHNPAVTISQRTIVITTDVETASEVYAWPVPRWPTPASLVLFADTWNASSRSRQPRLRIDWARLYGEAIRSALAPGSPDSGGATGSRTWGEFASTSFVDITSPRGGLEPSEANTLLGEIDRDFGPLFRHASSSEAVQDSLQDRNQAYDWTVYTRSLSPERVTQDLIQHARAFVGASFRPNVRVAAAAFGGLVDPRFHVSVRREARESRGAEGLLRLADMAPATIEELPAFSLIPHRVNRRVLAELSVHEVQVEAPKGSDNNKSFVRCCLWHLHRDGATTTGEKRVMFPGLCRTAGTPILFFPASRSADLDWQYRAVESWNSVVAETLQNPTRRSLDNMVFNFVRGSDVSTKSPRVALHAPLNMQDMAADPSFARQLARVGWTADELHQLSVALRRTPSLSKVFEVSADLVRSEQTPLLPLLPQSTESDPSSGDDQVTFSEGFGGTTRAGKRQVMRTKKDSTQPKVMVPGTAKARAKRQSTGKK